MAHFYFENVPHGKRRDGSKLNTQTHYEYICRQGSYAHLHDREEDLVYSANGNMPGWAENADQFWEQAELNRRKNGRAYREFRFALQEEFTLEENIALVEQLMDDYGIRDQHAFSYAIHDKTATFDKEHRNIHCHLMFSEKIFEKDRPLPAEKYFKQYAEDTKGNAVSGYRNSRQFCPKEATLDLRHHWAELCNTKFAEKGLPCRISEKSLSSQREDLLAQGRTDEAALLDRSPAPHLGSSYRNPKTMERIFKETEAADSLAEKTATAAEDTANVTTEPNASLKEQKLSLFANDLALRRIARQIQQERLRLAKQKEARIAAEKEQEEANQPMVITVGDIQDFLREKSKASDSTLAAKLTAYRQERSFIIPDKKLHAAAIDRLFNGRYAAACQDYFQSKKDLSKLKPQIEVLYNQPEQVHELAALMRAYQQTEQKRKTLGKQIGRYKKQLAGEYRDKLPAIEETLRQENEAHIHTSKQAYAAYLQEKKTVAAYSAVLLKLKEQAPEDVLYTEHLPRLLTRHCKIDGKIPIRQLKILSFHGDSYALLDPLPTNKNHAEIFAVKIGDEMHRGCVPKYLLQLDQANNKNWNISQVTTASTLSKKSNTIWIYPHRKSKAIAITSTNMANDSRYSQQRHSLIIDITKDLICKEKSHQFTININGESDVKDKAIHNEDNLYTSWIP
jgi:hypothetical protein